MKMTADEEGKIWMEFEVPLLDRILMTMMFFAAIITPTLIVFGYFIGIEPALGALIGVVIFGIPITFLWVYRKTE